MRGWAAGLGFQLALAADFTIAAESACFWEPFLERGFSADSGSTWLLPRLVGVARAKELLLLGRKLSGAEAAAWGIIHRAVPDDELEAATAALVEQLAGAATVAVGLTKQLHPALARERARRGDAERVVRARAVVAHGGLQGRPARLQGTATGPLQGPVRRPWNSRPSSTRSTTASRRSR